MENKICSVVKDLLPLYNDDVLRDESREFVEEHLKECQDCRQFNAEMEQLRITPIPEETEKNENTFLASEEEDAAHIKGIASRLRRRKYKTIIEIVAVFVAMFLLFTMVFQQATIYGNGMEPTYHSGQNVILNRMAYLIIPPKRGDVILYQHYGELLINRVVGVPGDKIEIIDNQLQINGKQVKVKNIASDIDPTGDITYPVILGKDEYFVLGDNLSVALDSRTKTHGIITEKEIKGKVFFKSISFIKTIEYTKIM
jgi:signal peptidase I